MARQSDLGPSTLVVVLALIWPTIILRRILLSPNGVADLSLSRTLLWGMFWLAQLRYHTIRHFTTPLRNLPRPKERLGSGIAKQLLKQPQFVALTRFARTVPNDGLILLRGLLHVSAIVQVTTPAALVEVLNSRAYDFEKPRHARKFLTRVLGNGIIVAEGKMHKAQRKSVTPAFQGKHVRELVPLFWSKAVQMADVIARGGLYSQEASSVRVDEKGTRTHDLEIGAIASRATLDIIGKAGFGADFNTLASHDNQLAQKYDLIFDPDKPHLVLYFLLNALLPMWLARKVPWKMNQRIIDAMFDLRDICKQLVVDKKINMQEKKDTSADVDILSVLMRNNELSDDDLVNQMLTFLAAGHETTSNALTWTCYLLSVYPETQARLRAELQASPLGKDPTAPVTADVIDSFPYMHAVCAELLRVYPTVPVTARSAIVDTMILDQPIPKGTEVIIPIWAINRSPELWGEDADEFKPERWLDEKNTAKMNSYEFITFLHGPRSCIGQGFARSELKCLLAALVLRFEFELADKSFVPKPRGAVSIKPDGGLRLKLTEIRK